jgi:hypothetical protein
MHSLPTLLYLNFLPQTPTYPPFLYTYDVADNPKASLFLSFFYMPYKSTVLDYS